MADADVEARADQAVPGEAVADDSDSRRRHRQSVRPLLGAKSLCLQRLTCALMARGLVRPRSAG